MIIQVLLSLENLPNHHSSLSKQQNVMVRRSSLDVPKTPYLRFLCLAKSTIVCYSAGWAVTVSNCGSPVLFLQHKVTLQCFLISAPGLLHTEMLVLREALFWFFSSKPQPEAVYCGRNCFVEPRGLDSRPAFTPLFKIRSPKAGNLWELFLV